MVINELEYTTQLVVYTIKGIQYILKDESYKLEKLKGYTFIFLEDEEVPDSLKEDEVHCRVEIIDKPY